MPFLHILPPTEINQYESPAHFDDQERKKFFTLPPDLRQAIEHLRTPSSQISFVLQVGYFRSSQRFFGPQSYPADLTFVAAQLALPRPDSLRTPKQTLARYRQTIMEFYGYRQLDANDKEQLAQEITLLVKHLHRPADIFRQTLQKLKSRKLVLPHYHFLAALIARTIKQRKVSLNQIIKKSLSVEQKQLLDSLLEKEEQQPVVIAAPDSDDGKNEERSARVKLTLLKHPSQSLKLSDMKSNLNDWTVLQAMYAKVANVITTLNLSPETLRYYAEAVLKSEVFQISRQKDEVRYLHLLAFIASQTFRYQDILVDSFLQTVQNITNSATQEHREKLFRERQEKRVQLCAFLATVQTDILLPLLAVERILAALAVPTDEKLQQIANVLLGFQAARPTVEGRLAQLLTATDKTSDDREFYQILQQKSLSLQKRTADIVRLLQVEEKTVPPDLFQALQYFQATDGQLEKNAPRGFLSEKEQTVINLADQKFPVSLYKALLFQKIAHGIKSGQVNFAASHKYRSLDDYLIPASEWQASAQDLLEKADLAHWQDWQRLQPELARMTHESFTAVNQNLKNNAWFKSTATEDWSISTPAIEKAWLGGMKEYFPTRQLVSLAEVFSTVQQATGFLAQFTHWQIATKHKRPTNQSLCAAIMGMGCEIGIGKMSHIAKNVGTSELENTVHQYLSNDNLWSANAHLLDFVGKLELPNVYRREQDKLHTSSDGQKYEVSVPSLNANYSFKYFGQNKGVSVYSFIDERHLLFYSTVISSSEREAAYVIDGLLHNEALKSDLHSTDSHGFTEVVFAVTHLLGFTFAPRLKTLCKHQLYSFEKRKSYTEQSFTLVPDAYIDTQLIAENWDEIRRFVATIKLKRTSASQLFKRLNSYANQHPLYQALKEFGKIIKTLFILRYVDEVELRQAIEKQLNKIEHAQRFAKAIAFANNQEFSEGDQQMQDVTANCRRLIENTVIAWNYLYLTQKLTELSNEPEKQSLLAAFKASSIITWQHINFHGEYDFSEEKFHASIRFDLPKIMNWKLV